jgi:diguanylate cyclase (GGDEF)-like protein
MAPAMMDAPVPAEGVPPSRLRAFCDLHNRNFIAALFLALMALQTLGYLILGTGTHGMALSQFLLVLHNLLALGCAWIAFRRAHGTAALFWLLFAACLLILLVPAIVLLATTVFHQTLVSDFTWRVLYCLYGAPVLMMLFLPTDQRARLGAEIFLDLFQVVVIVGLCYSTFFYLPLRRMLPDEALLRHLNISNLLSLFLLFAVFVRLQFARATATRSLLHRLGIFVLFCAVVTFIGNWIDLHHYVSASAWFDLGWALPYVAAGLVAFTWEPASEPPFAARPANLVSFLGANLFLVAILFCVYLLMDKWKQTHGTMYTTVAVAATLLAFTFRLALTQYHQQQEIARREAAQEKLFLANQTITGLLENARIETSAITRINELGSLLQACSSRDEAFRVIPERLARLFPGTSGALSVLNASRTRAESVAEWGLRPPLQNAPAQRAGSAPVATGEASALPSDPPPAGGASIFAPLIANGEALGVLALRDDDPPSEASSPSPAHDLSRRQQMASSVAEHIALTISNLDLHEALRLQATRDPLTGLFNRRYMQESLEREIHRALRRRRALAVMMLDIDHFKRYNDTFGHAAGDEALRLVAETLLHSVRSDDLACRYGGEEFLVILPECSLPQAAIRAEEIRERLKDLHRERASELPAAVTVSIGVAAFKETADEAEPLLKCADEALYQAKREGRDRVVIAHPATPIPVASLPHA